MKRSQGKRKAESSRSSTKCGCGLGELDEWVMSKCTVLLRKGTIPTIRETMMRMSREKHGGLLFQFLSCTLLETGAVHAIPWAA